jgi:hypothetical protein
VGFDDDLVLVKEMDYDYWADFDGCSISELDLDSSLLHQNKIN